MDVPEDVIFKIVTFVHVNTFDAIFLYFDLSNTGFVVRCVPKSEPRHDDEKKFAGVL